MNVKIIRGKILLVMTFLSVWHEWNKSASWNKVNTVRYVIAICLDLPVLGRVDIVIGVLFAMFCSKWYTMLAKFVGINQVKVVAFMTFMSNRKQMSRKVFLQDQTVYQSEFLWGALRKLSLFSTCEDRLFSIPQERWYIDQKIGRICFWYLENSQKLKRAVYNAGSKCSE